MHFITKVGFNAEFLEEKNQKIKSSYFQEIIEHVFLIVVRTQSILQHFHRIFFPNLYRTFNFELFFEARVLKNYSAEIKNEIIF